VECCKLVRPATLEELGEVYESIELTSFDNPYSPYYMRVLWSLSAGEYFLVAIGEKGLTGYVAAVPLQGGVCHIASIAVKPECRRRKVASCLLASLFELCSANGYRSFVLEVEHRNKPALALYARHGFKPLGLAADYYGRGRHALIMVYVDEPSWHRL
jgi:ribosomal-protein-alanine N-acetyltransferase